MSDSNHEQVVRMLKDALELVERNGGLGVEIHILTRDGISEFRWFAMDAPEVVDMAEFAAMPCDSRVQ